MTYVSQERLDMTDSPITLHSANPARDAVKSLTPEGILLAPVWRRGAALFLDVLLVVLPISLLTNGRFYVILLDFEFIQTSLSVLLIHILLHFASFWLYFKYSAKSLGRSFGQRAMRVAIVHDDASLLTEQHWNKRAILKLRYIIPVLGIFIGFVDLFYAHFTKEKRTLLDKSNFSIAVLDWTLPAESRFQLR